MDVIILKQNKSIALNTAYKNHLPHFYPFLCNTTRTFFCTFGRVKTGVYFFLVVHYCHVPVITLGHNSLNV